MAPIARWRSSSAPPGRTSASLRGTLATSRHKLAADPIERTAIIFVGPALAAEDFRESSLYDAAYQRRFRGRDGAYEPACKGRLPHQHAVAVEDQDFELRCPYPSARPPPSARRRRRWPRRPERRRRVAVGKGFGNGVGAHGSRLASSADAPASGATAASASRSAAPRLECRSSMPCASLVILATPPAIGHARHRMVAQIFQHAADEIAHVDQLHLVQPVEFLRRDSPTHCRSRRRHGQNPWRGRHRCRDGSNESRTSRNRE